jgi:Family of unknown function (DUF6622)
METLVNALKGTPWWVYVLFIYLIYIGVQAMKPQKISINKLFILPLLFLAWSIYGIIAHFASWMDPFAWLIAGIGGFFCGENLAPKKLRADRKKLIAQIPGSSITLILVVAIFILKYFFGYYRATHDMTSSGVHIASLIVSGVVAGIFIGRTRATLVKFSKAKHENLKKNGNPRKKSLI